MLDLYVDHTVVILILMVMVMTKNRSYFKTTDKSMSKRCGPKPRRYVWTTTVIFWDTMQTRSSSLINNYILWTGRRPNLEQFVILLLNGFTNLPLWSFESKTRIFLLFSDNPAFAIIPPSTYPDLDPCSRGPQHKKNRSDPVPRSLKGGLCKAELNNNTKFPTSNCIVCWFFTSSIQNIYNHKKIFKVTHKYSWY